LPDSSVSISAMRSISRSIRSATFRRIVARSLPDARDQSPASKTRRAAAMAASVSAWPPLAAILTVTPWAGDCRSDVAPSALSTHAPSIRWRAVNGTAGRAAPLAGMIVSSVIVP
jgi:hypothetical protein